MVEPPSFTPPVARGVKIDFRLTLRALWVFFAFLMIPVETTGAADAGQEGLRLLDAVKVTIRNQPDIRIKEQEVDVSRGKLQVETGAFDTTLNASARYDRASRPLGSYEQFEFQDRDEISDMFTTSFGLGKQFRNGISINPNVSLSRTDIEPLGFTTSLHGPSNTATVDFEITFPLLKGRGAETTAANEISARKNLEASALTLRQAISTNVLNTVQAYWDYLAATRTVRQRVESEGRAKRIADDMGALVAGKEKPASEMEQLSGNLAAKTAARLADDQQMVDARHKLGLAMGLQSDEIEFLQSAFDDFPELGAREVDTLGKIGKQLGELALQRRADYLESRTAEEAALVLVTAAGNNLRSQLDLTLGAGYNGLDEGSATQRYLASLTQNVRGYNASVSLSYKWPVENNSARGILLQRDAEYRKAVISTQNLGRNIGSNVSQSIAALRNKTLELAKHREAVQYYLKAVENEKQKGRLGTSTTLDLLTTEDQLTSAVVNQIAAQAAFAKALVKLRHETGTLLMDKGEEISVGASELTSLPQF